MKKILFALPTLLVLSAHSAFGYTQQEVDALSATDPLVSESLQLIQKNTPADDRRAKGNLARVLSESRNSISNAYTKRTQGAALSEKEARGLARSFMRVAQVLGVESTMLKYGYKTSAETRETQQTATQLKASVQEATQKADTAVQDGCAGVFAGNYDLMDSIKIIETTNLAGLSPQQVQATSFAFDQLSNSFVKLFSSTLVCKAYLQTPSAPKASGSASPYASGSYNQASPTNVSNAPKGQSPAQTIDGELAQVRPDLMNRIKDNNSDDPACKSAIGHIMKADAAAQAGYRALSETFRKQGHMTTGLLNEFEMTLDSASNIPTLFQVYTDACSPTVQETNASLRDAAKMEMRTEATFMKNGVLSDLIERGECRAAIITEHGFKPPAPYHYETAGQGGLSPAQRKAMEQSNNATSQAATTGANLARNCAGWAVEELKPAP